MRCCALVFLLATVFTGWPGLQSFGGESASTAKTGEAPAATPLARVRQAALTRVERRKCDEKARKLQQKITDQIAQRMKDNADRTWDACAVDVAKDWLFDRRVRLENGDASVWDDAAAFFMLFYDRGVHYPPDIQADINEHEWKIVALLAKD
jgi:hypothetical protein